MPGTHAHTHPAPLPLGSPQNTALHSSACRKLPPSPPKRCQWEQKSTRRPFPQVWLLHPDYVVPAASAASHWSLVTRVRCASAGFVAKVTSVLTDNHLSEMRGLFVVTIGGFCILERKHTVDDRLELPLSNSTVHGKKMGTTPTHDGPQRDKIGEEGTKIDLCYIAGEPSNHTDLA